MTDILTRFLDAVMEDPRITAAHISLYVALWVKWTEGGYAEPLYVAKPELMKRCKLSSYNSYHRIIRGLHEFGYIHYVPSFNPRPGSLVYMRLPEKRTDPAARLSPAAGSVSF